jgi:hypothetical protein
MDCGGRYARGADGNSRARIPAAHEFARLPGVATEQSRPSQDCQVTNRYFMAVATQGVMQVATIVIMARLATGI